MDGKGRWIGNVFIEKSFCRYASDCAARERLTRDRASDNQMADMTFSWPRLK